MHRAFNLFKLRTLTFTMKKQFIFFLLAALLSLTATAKQIPIEKAMIAGANFLQQQSISTEGLGLQLVYTESGNRFGFASAPFNYFYIFNFNKGFVIVSADDCAIPILGYSTENRVDISNIPINMKKWLEGYKQEIRYGIEHDLQNEATLALWEMLFRPANVAQKTSSATSVAPLIQTKWDQSPYYNDLCPFDASKNERTVAGCVATAMGQVMKYWNYPQKGRGYHSYSHPLYGNISANFGATTYDWASMPNVVDTTNNAVATLLFQLGVAVEMLYNVSGAGGSLAFPISAKSPIQHCAEFALKEYFAYSDNLAGIEKSNFTTTQWLSILKGEFDAGRPVIYAGFGSGGHCFVADGYDSNNLIHFNWGWGGQGPDGYYSVYAIIPADLGTGGGGGGGFTAWQQAIVGIHPPATLPNYNMQLASSAKLVSDSVFYTLPITLNAAITNTGAGAFTGELSAIAFDTYNNMVAFIETKGAQTIPSNGTLNVSLSTTGLTEILPGTYTVGIFYRAAGEALWNPVANIGSFYNFDSLVVFYSNDIELYAQMQSAQMPLVKDSIATITANFKNEGNSSFTGNYYTALFTPDGNFVQLIDSIAEVSGLPAGGYYNNPIAFSAPITAPPGSYLIAALHEPIGDSLQLSGSSYFQNPGRITVKEPDLPADIYEVNNTTAQAFSLPVNFIGDSAFVYTTGSNIHIGTDMDHYKIVLPPGYSYKLKSRVYDAQHSFIGTPFTADVLFNYSPDGINYTEVIDGDIVFDADYDNGGTFYAGIYPFFFGGTGTYLLEVKIERQTVLPVSFISFNATLKSKNMVVLDWQIKNNPQNAFFEVERSADGKAFNKISTIKNTTNVLSQSFSYLDEHPNRGKNFYRIKQVDVDGKYIYSDVRMIDCSEITDFVVGPNPATNSITVRFNTVLPHYTVSLMNTAGKRMYYADRTNRSVEMINTEKLPDGIYFLDVVYGNMRKQVKVIINR